MLKYFNAFFFVLLMISCASEQRSAMQPTASAIAKTNEIIVVCDQKHWDGELGDSIRYYYESPYLILPQPESNFDLRHFTAEELANQPLRKKLRTYLLVGDLRDQDSRTTKLMMQDISQERMQKAKDLPTFNTMIGKNKWAQGQILIYFFAFGEEQLIKNIPLKYPAIAQRVRDFDENQIGETVYVFGENRDLNLKVKERMGVNSKIPLEYKLAVEDLGRPMGKDTTNFIWLRKETEEVSSNIMVYSFPYTSKEQFSKKGMKQVRDQLGKQYISTSIEGSFMQINDVDLPMYAGEVDLNGNYAWESRGIWEMEGDFMGGAFVSYLILNEAEDELIYADGFVYAPGKSKRDYMMQVEHVLKSIKM